MIHLKKFEFPEEILLKDFLAFDSKTNLYKAAKSLGMYGYSQYSKAELVGEIAYYVIEHSYNVLSNLSLESLRLVKELVMCGHGGGIRVPVKEDGNLYQLQELDLVISFDDDRKDAVPMVMPDDVREAFADCIDVILMNAEKREREKEGFLAFYDSVYGKDYEVPASYEFLPIYSRKSSVEIPEGQDRGFEIISNNLIHLVIRESADLFMNVYYFHENKRTIRVMCCVDRLIEDITTYASTPSKYLGFPPSFVRKKAPFTYKMLDNPFTSDFGGAYLYFYQFSGRNSMWFIMKDVEDYDMVIWPRFVESGPLDDFINEHKFDIKDIIDGIIGDVKTSKNPELKQKLGEFMA